MNWKIVIIGFVALLAIGFGLTAHIKSQKKISVEFVEAVPQKVFPDGSYTAGKAAYYNIDPSPALMWKITGSNSKTWRVAAFIVIGLVAVYLGLCGAGVIIYNHKPFFGGLVAAAAFWFAAYSSAFEQNAVQLTPEEYEKVKDNLPSLWNKDNIIR